MTDFRSSYNSIKQKHLAVAEQKELASGEVTAGASEGRCHCHEFKMKASLLMQSKACEEALDIGTCLPCQAVAIGLVDQIKKQAPPGLWSVIQHVLQQLYPAQHAPSL